MQEEEQIILQEVHIVSREKQLTLCHRKNISYSDRNFPVTGNVFSLQNIFPVTGNSFCDREFHPMTENFFL